MIYRAAGKRVADVLFSLTALVALSPVLLLLAAMIRLKLGRPVLFKQERPGKDGRPFVMWKFRTMRGDPGQGSDEERLTPFGRFLRASSLDELPEFVNVLRGEMSVIGPRPLLMRYLPLYTPEQARRQEVLPGITGWAQVNGRNAVSWERKFELDVWYVDHLSAWLDLRILGLTLAKVVLREGVSADGHATMPEFTGSKGRSR